MKAFATALMCAALCACQSASPASDAGFRVYVIAALVDGHPNPPPDAAASAAATAGHFANIKRLSQAGDLLLAGPSGDPESEFRGLFLFNVESVDQARALVASDPAVAAGFLHAELTTLRSASPLFELPRLVKAARARRLALNPSDPAEGFVGRPYVLATTNRGQEAERRLAPLIRAGHVLFHGHLGPPAEGSAIFLLDVETLAGARAALENSDAFRGLGASWALDLWWATEALVELPGLASAR